jgi:rhamnosyl/mannosyltransferase
VWNFDPVVIPNAIDTTTFNPGNKGDSIRERWDLGDRFVVMYVGRIKFHKGIDFLVESALKTESDIHYLIVGDGDFMDALKGEVKQYELEDRVTFTGNVSDEDLPKYYAACDVFVLPSVSRLEAFGLVGLEAMATRKPVIVSSIPGVREVVDDGVEGLWVDPMNSEDLARKINSIRSRPKQARRMGRNGRNKVVSRFSWRKVINNIEDLYNDILGRGK